MRQHLEKLGVFSKDRVNINAQRMIRRRAGLEQQIKKKTSFLPIDASLKERLTTIFYSYKKVPQCPYCKKNRTFDERGSYCYNATCGNKECHQIDRLNSLNIITRAISSKKRKIKLEEIGIDGLTGFQRMYEKQHQTKVDRGLYAPYYKHSDFMRYRANCMKMTKLNDLTKLENFQLRGPRQPGFYELDHKVSIQYGFAKSIGPEIIGHICNLEMVPWSINASKNSKCSFRIEELLQEISKYQG